jgi:hypothetical protein
MVEFYNVYTRENKKPRLSPVENGTPLQGTWTRAFNEVDLLSVHKPYSISLPKGIKTLRVKEWESFIIKDDRYLLQIKFCNMKYNRIALVIMYDCETRERLEFSKVIPGGGWHLPKSLGNSSVDSRSSGFFLRIHAWLEINSILLEINIKGNRKRPALTAHVAFDLAEEKTTPMAVSLLFSERRNMYAYKAMTAVEGDVVSGGQHIHFSPEKTSGIFCDCKGYYPRRAYSTWCSALGFDSNNRRFGFSFGENQTREPFSNNENALWIDGKLTPLPPVKITRNVKDEKDWIIQDMEGMVDLVFTPKEPERNIRNPVFSVYTRMLFGYDYENPQGCFNGVLVDADGKELPVKNAWGTGERLFLRI